MAGIPTVGDLVYQGIQATDAVFASASDEIAVIVRGLPETIGERDRIQAISQIDNVLDRSFGRTPQRAKASDLYDAIVTTRNAAVNAPYDKAAAYINDVLQNTGLYRGLYGPVVQAQRANQAALFDPERRWVREDGYRLSDRVWRQGRRMREQIDTVIRDGIREGIGADKLARRLEQYIDPSHAATTWTRKGVRKRSVPQRPYAASSARRLARTEIMHAYGMATIQSTKDTPGAIGIQWRTSGNHPNPDECDVHASRDGYKLGRGVYPVDEVPRYPEHPNCLCVLSPAMASREEVLDAIIKDIEHPADPVMVQSQVAAERLYAKAKAAEPAVTRDLRTLESRIDGDLNAPFKLANGQTAHPLDARLKTVESTARKIAGDATDMGSVDAAAAGIKDNLRYTYTVAEGTYGQSVNTVLNGLDEMGYERLKVKNMWRNDEGYTSVHAIYRTADGQPFEVQFHTSRTIATKELISHPLYELQRKLPTDSPEWWDYQRQIDAAWRVIRDNPPNLSGLP